MAQSSFRDPASYSRRTKNILVIILDFMLLVASLYFALYLRLGSLDGVGTYRVPFEYLVYTIVFSAIILGSFRLYRLKMHEFDAHAVRRLGIVSGFIACCAALISFLFGLWIPRSVPFIYGFLFFGLSVVFRVVIVATLERLRNRFSERLPVAIYGAGSAGIQLAAALRQSREMRPMVFVDDNPSLQGLIVSGIRVRNLKNLPPMVKSGEIKRVIVAISSLSVSQRETLVKRLNGLGCDVEAIPSYVDLLSGKHTVSDLQPIKTEQLLGRDKVELDVPEVARAYDGQTVMVTGAGGSIGSELCRQILKCGIARLVLFERSEPALYEVERTLQADAAAQGKDIISCLGSIIDPNAVQSAIADNGVDVIFHAAAYKHVPIVECNEVEGARNNVLGTKVLADAASRNGIQRFIQISTDKAVRPTNIMGATKRLAELVIQDVQKSSSTTIFTMVRFGNVLGSSGSVVPLFSKQIEAGGPVTVTHPDVTRYFMTIPEAARLVLLAGAYAEGSDLFILNMGEPIRISELAERMIVLSGRTVKSEDNPNGDIEIKYIGLRPGEKLYEELLIDDDTLTKTPHEKILRANVRGLSSKDMEAMLKRMQDGLRSRDPAIIREVVEKYVAGYSAAKIA